MTAGRNTANAETLLDRMAKMLRHNRAPIEDVSPKTWAQTVDLLAEYDRLRAADSQPVVSGDVAEARECLRRMVTPMMECNASAKAVSLMAEAARLLDRAIGQPLKTADGAQGDELIAAMPRRLCERCGGSGQISDSHSCFDCKGKGYVNPHAPWTCRECGQLNAAYSNDCGRCEVNKHASTAWRDAERTALTAPPSNAVKTGEGAA